MKIIMRKMVMKKIGYERKTNKTEAGDGAS